MKFKYNKRKLVETFVVVGYIAAIIIAAIALLANPDVLHVGMQVRAMEQETQNKLLKNSNAFLDRDNTIWAKDDFFTKLQKSVLTVVSQYALKKYSRCIITSN